MILEDMTFEAYGYYAKDLKPKSRKFIITACELCGEFKTVKRHNYHTFCRSCCRKGKHHTEKTKRKMSKNHVNMKGANNSNWKNGISFEPYCIKFNASFKRNNRDQFNNVCFLCGKTEEENCRALDVHHVNYNKQCGCDDTKCVCVPLCRSCHMKTNNNRDWWEKLIMSKLKETLLGYM